MSLIIGVMSFMAPLFHIHSAQAAIPRTINYQSRLLNASAQAVTSTTSIRFSLYNHPSNGTYSDVPGASGALVWSESYDQLAGSCASITPDFNGYFYVRLGTCSAFPAYLTFNEPLYLGVKIGADPEASPRVPFSAHPYALNSERVNNLQATTTAQANQLLALDSNLNFNIATGTFYGAGLSITGTSTFQNIAFTLATGTTLNLTTALTIGGISLDAIGTNNITSGASLVGVFDEFTNSNSTTVQSVLRDFDVAISSVSSSLYSMTLQQVTFNGNTTTESIQFAGGTSTGDFNPDADLTRNLGTPTNRWNSVQAGDIIANNVSSTNAVFMAATSSNFFVDLFSFNSASGTNLNVQNSTTVNAFVNNLEVLGANITNLDVTNVTTTNFVATNATFTSINVTEPIDLSNLVWVNATGTNTTSTNLYSQKLTALTAAISDLNFGNATGSVMALSSYLAINGIRLDAVGTSNVTSGASLIGIFDEFANSNAVTVQGALRDLDLAISSVSTTMSIFDLQMVTDRGNVTTNAIQFAGGTSTASLSISGTLSVNNVALGSLGTDPTNSGATLSGVFDEFNNFNATTVQSALKAIDTALSTVSSSSSQQAYFVGFTSSTTDGSFSYAGKIGYQAANAACAAAFAESHFCRTDEVIATIADQDIAALFAAGTYGWIAEGPPGYTANSNDCAGYTSHSNTVLGAFWAYDPNGGGMGWLNNCSVLRQISCCSK